MQIRNTLYTASAILGRPRPFVLYHKPTSRCDCRCIFCDSWRHQARHDDVLPTADIISLLDNARQARITTYTLWGGEPLLVNDLPIWLEHAKRSGLRTIMCTSGCDLETRAQDIAPYIDVLLLSIESTGARHDRIRRFNGLFDNVMNGLRIFKKHTRGIVIIWCNIGEYNKDHVRDVAALAREQGIYVEFFPASWFPGYNDDYVLNTHEREPVFSLIRALKNRGYPVHNTGYGLDLMRTSSRFTCNTARVSVFVNPDGNMYPCDPYMVSKKITYGDIRSVDIREIPHTRAYKKAMIELAHCNKCLLPCVAHTANDLVFQSLRRLFNRGQAFHSIHSQGINTTH